MILRSRLCLRTTSSSLQRNLQRTPASSTKSCLVSSRRLRLGPVPRVSKAYQSLSKASSNLVRRLQALLALHARVTFCFSFAFLYSPSTSLAMGRKISVLCSSSYEWHSSYTGRSQSHNIVSASWPVLEWFNPVYEPGASPRTLSRPLCGPAESPGSRQSRWNSDS